MHHNTTIYSETWITQTAVDHQKSLSYEKFELSEVELTEFHCTFFFLHGDFTLTVKLPAKLSVFLLLTV